MHKNATKSKQNIKAIGVKQAWSIKNYRYVCNVSGALTSEDLEMSSQRKISLLELKVLDLHELHLKLHQREQLAGRGGGGAALTVPGGGGVDAITVEPPPASTLASRDSVEREREIEIGKLRSRERQRGERERQRRDSFFSVAGRRCTCTPVAMDILLLSIQPGSRARVSV
jgi:hypothetical protein